MKWVANICDPGQPNAQAYVTRSPYVTNEQRWQEYQQWLQGKIIGEPQVLPGSPRTIEELKVMHLVGVYVQEEIA